MLDDKQKKEVDKVKEAVTYINQNIHIVKKVNEANHNYQTMRVKARRRINRRASLFNIERKAEERAIQKTLGVDSYFGESRSDVIFWGVVTVGFWIVTAYLVWVIQ